MISTFLIFQGKKCIYYALGITSKYFLSSIRQMNKTSVISLTKYLSNKFIETFCGVKQSSLARNPLILTDTPLSMSDVWSSYLAFCNQWTS